ncbi:hypothetical protein CCR85_05435 [Rhodothalassium salexigens]|uniref:PEP-CTERM/exosortase system-associated acyltransferase n=1 Tax=Rhodothalassium salexigens TaxID=1086 RepID=UPI001912A206|nr:PEP-CTERM/exosortase system-associated acyltransferase [Rhodothalassium salexigens]MBK5910935.1 hypothetical protein [Rhodothalassium salexigens]
MGLCEVYNNYFDVVRCNCDATLKEAFRLRYQVYCVETGFEDPPANPGEMERDAFDEHSLHSLLIHRQSGTVAGCVRLILPQEHQADYALPARQVSSVLRDIDEAVLPGATSAEASRFAISKEFRKRLADGLYPDNNERVLNGEVDEVDNHKRVLPNMVLGLIRGVFQMAYEAEQTHLITVIEPFLYRRLSSLGLVFTKTGETIEYHGRRIPNYRGITTLLHDAHAKQPDVWETITEYGQVWPLDGAPHERHNPTARLALHTE